MKIKIKCFIQFWSDINLEEAAEYKGIHDGISHLKYRKKELMIMHWTGISNTFD